MQNRSHPTSLETSSSWGRLIMNLTLRSLRTSSSVDVPYVYYRLVSLGFRRFMRLGRQRTDGSSMLRLLRAPERPARKFFDLLSTRQLNDRKQCLKS